MKKISILIICLFCSIVFSDPYEQLDIDFLKKKKSKEQVQPKTVKLPKSNLPTYEDKIKDLEYFPGLFDFYWDKNQNKLYISIKHNQFV